MAITDNHTTFYRLNLILSRPLQVVCLVFILFTFSSVAYASPFGQGNFGANVPFGSLTSISMALGSNVTLNLTPSGSNFSASSSTTVTITSDDVNGYDLFIFSNGSSNLTNGSFNIPASSNTTEAALTPEAWGYNTDGSTNYIGSTTYPVLLVSTSGPYISGNTTTVYFGVLTDILAPEGSYSGNVTYTAVSI